EAEKSGAQQVLDSDYSVQEFAAPRTKWKAPAQDDCGCQILFAFLCPPLRTLRLTCSACPIASLFQVLPAPGRRRCDRCWLGGFLRHAGSAYLRCILRAARQWCGCWLVDGWLAWRRAILFGP